jgi:predicted Zn-dependent protease
VNTADGTRVYITGSVYLDAAKANQMRRKGISGVVQEVVEHELGHLVGLSHVNDPTQIMYPRASTHVLTYQAGDLTGLAALGKGACTSEL